MPAPAVGITVDVVAPSSEGGRCAAALAYVQGVAAAGGTPLLLPPAASAVARYVELCDAFVFTGGDDPRMEFFGRGEATHPAARVMDPVRQRFEMALIAALDRHPHKPVLGICWGMQLLALHAGGRLHQHLPEVLGEAASVHAGNQRHGLRPAGAGWSRLLGVAAPAGHLSPVVSSHHQAVADPGRLEVAAVAEDGVIEAVCDPGRVFHVGVQWHPERGDAGLLGQGLFGRLLAATQQGRRDQNTPSP